MTENDVCFTAFLPSTQGKTLMSGSLSKMAHRGSRLTRSWFVLRPDQLSFYHSAKELYFPLGAIDLRFAFQADLVPETPGGDKYNSTLFSLVTEQRTHTFKADNPVSAQLWVKSLQRAIFLSRNEGDQVKIKIPVENIVDLEESNLQEFGVALKVRAIDSEETFSIDEYVLAFLHPSKKSEVPLEAIRRVMDKKGIKDINPKIGTEKLVEELSESRRTLGRITDSTYSIGSSPIAGQSPTRLGSSSPILYPTDDASSPGKSVTGLGRRVTRRVRNIVGRDGSQSRSTSPSRLQPGQANANTAAGVLPLQKEHITAHEDSSILTQEDSYMDVSPNIFPMDGLSRENSHSRDHSRERHLEEVSPTLLATTIGMPAIAATATSQLPTATQSTTSLLPGFRFGRGHTEAEKKKRVHGTMVHKVSDMFTSTIKHYQKGSDEYVDSDDLEKLLVSDEERKESNKRFQAHFSFGEDEELVATYYAHIQKPIPIYGKIYVSMNFVCFRSLILGTKTKMVVPYKDIENVSAENGFKFGYSGLVIVIHGHEDVFFEFSSRAARDDCEAVTCKRLDVLRMQGSLTSSSFGGHDEAVHTPQERLRLARLHTYEDTLRSKGGVLDGGTSPAIIESRDHAAPLLPTAEKPRKVYHFTCVTIGSRGDVQPYIALCKGLLKEGHKCRIATHAEFKDWVESYGIEFREVAGDPGELMKIMIEHGMFSVSFLRDAASRFRGWIDELLHTTWEACQGSDVIIESPSAMAGIHVAEALNIPYFRAFTMPWTRTRTYPHAFMVPEQKMGGSYNHLTYVLFENVFWKGISSQVNKWRVKELGLDKTNLELLRQNEVPFLYNVSPSVLVPPVDYPDWVRVTGYWFLDEGAADTFKPPQDLVDFMDTARKDKKKIVYIGFGSIVVSNPAEMTKAVVESVLKAGVRCILSKGWSERFGDKDAANKIEVPLPKEIFQIKSAPHDWLFPQIDAAVHHGGSGTTGASLRAGLPTIIKPFFGDQFFYAGRVEDLGVGVFLKKLTVNAFSKAIVEVTTNPKVIKKAKLLGSKIRKEHGVDTAIALIYWQMDYAMSLVKKRRQKEIEKEHDSFGITGILSPVGGAISRTFTASAEHAGALASLAYRPLLEVSGVGSSNNNNNSNSAATQSSPTLGQSSSPSSRGFLHITGSSYNLPESNEASSSKTSTTLRPVRTFRKIIGHSEEEEETGSESELSVPTSSTESTVEVDKTCARTTSNRAGAVLSSITSRTRSSLTFSHPSRTNSVASNSSTGSQGGHGHPHHHHLGGIHATHGSRHSVHGIHGSRHSIHKTSVGGSASSSSEDTHKTDESWTLVGDDDDDDSN